MFEHRHLIVQRALSPAERRILLRITRGLPRLRVLRELMEAVYRLFGRRCRTDTEFLGSSETGPRAAVLFTIPAGAKRHRPEPWAYLRDVLLRLSAGETDLEPLLPDRWAARYPEHVLQHRLDESRRKAARQKEARQTRRAAAVPKG